MKPSLSHVRAALVLVLLVWGAYSLGQNQSNSISIGQTVQIKSAILNQSRSLTISKPEGYDDSPDRYPVLYLLDGESNFEFTAAIVQFLAENDRIPGMIVVGIHSGDPPQRTHDLTPPSQIEIENRFSPGNGEPTPSLHLSAANSCLTSTRTTALGHTEFWSDTLFGGLFAIYALATQPTLFNAYIAIDPTAGWNNGTEIVRVHRVLSELKDLQADLFISAANDLGMQRLMFSSSRQL